jgi:hypothetical protein
VGPPVQRVQLEILVLLGQLVRKAIQALVVLLAQPVQLEILDLLGRLVLKAIQDLEDFKETKVLVLFY